MNPTHAQALKRFDARVLRVLILRRAVRWSTGWFFLWGAVVLAARIAGGARAEWLLPGVFGFVPLVLVAAWLEQRRRPQFAQIRARYDASLHCGGVMMAEEAADMGAWQGGLPESGSPQIHWRSGRAMLGLICAGAFLALAMLLPDRLTHLGSKPPLEIGQLVEQLQTEVKTLEQEKIIDDKKSNDVQKQLAQLKQDSSAFDPNKTWEALDHIKEGNNKSAKEAADEALNKLSQLASAETLAAALAEAAEKGLDPETATAAAQQLASMVNAAKLDQGLLKGEMPSDLLKNLEGLNPQDLTSLMSALKSNDGSLNKTIANLSNLKLIDPKFLAQCKSLSQGKNAKALADYLSQCNSTNKCDSAMVAAMCNGRGGVDEGGGPVPMTWKDPSSEEGAKFQEHQLLPGHKMDDAQFVGVSKTAPQLADEKLEVGPGSLADATASGGSANSATVLPRHKQAVQNFFKRDEK